jgi:hypothetical protein
VLVVSRDLVLCDVVPFIGHDLLNGLEGEWSMLPNLPFLSRETVRFVHYRVATYVQLCWLVS